MPGVTFRNVGDGGEREGHGARRGQKLLVYLSTDTLPYFFNLFDSEPRDKERARDLDTRTDGH